MWSRIPFVACWDMENPRSLCGNSCNRARRFRVLESSSDDSLCFLVLHEGALPLGTVRLTEVFTIAPVVTRFKAVDYLGVG